MVVFLVRVMSFMMSRRAQDTGVQTPKSVSDVTKQDHRARQRPAKHHRNRDMVQDEGADTNTVEGQQGGPLTREEMTRLFGNALRVR